VPHWRQATDSELVAAALAGDQEGYRQIVRRFERPVYALIVRMVRRPELAEELAQEAFVKAFGALASFEPDKKLSSWLFKIAHNTTIDHLRRKRPSTVPLDAPSEDERGLAAVLEDESTESPERGVELADLARLLEEALAELRPEYREIVVLRYQEGLSYNELAEVMDLPLGTVKTHLHRARKELAELAAARGLGPAGPGGETRSKGPA
jgi:RNA polymerase sigma-70 factor (ECF subfamily)